MQPRYRSDFKSCPPPGQLKVAVLMGGISRERDVSIESGRCVAEALKQAGVNVVVADVKPDKLDVLEDESINVFFIALHGTFGEDGVLQEILESKGLTYTSSSPQASRLAFDKWASKKRFDAAGIVTPGAILFEADANMYELEDRIRQLGKKYVIKPLREGSTIGISIVDEPKAAIAAAQKCAKEFGECMIEAFIGGREITVGVLGNEALPIIEIRPRAGFYDYHAKYIDDQTEYLFDTIEDASLAARIQKTAIDCFNTLAAGRSEGRFNHRRRRQALCSGNQHHSRNDEPFAFAKGSGQSGAIDESVVYEDCGNGFGQQ